MKVRVLLDLCRRMSSDADVEISVNGKESVVDSAELLATQIPGRKRLMLYVAKPTPVKVDEVVSEEPAIEEKKEVKDFPHHDAAKKPAHPQTRK